MKFLHFAEAFLFFLKVNEFFVNCSVSQELIDKLDRGRQKHAGTSETKNGSVDTTLWNFSEAENIKQILLFFIRNALSLFALRLALKKWLIHSANCSIISFIFSLKIQWVPIALHFRKNIGKFITTALKTS